MFQWYLGQHRYDPVPWLTSLVLLGAQWGHILTHTALFSYELGSTLDHLLGDGGGWW